MLAEKFFLILETLISHNGAETATYGDGAPKVVTRTRFIPVKLPAN